ncbi:RNA polymerase sigma factor [Arcticibacter sp. MXS-1]|uniref:RNA polymerase sigma factor n=1 Tax=Arcticibacter sp. MXS-1 TaxID=3341726 RepID=UPI0035A9A640
MLLTKHHDSLRTCKTYTDNEAVKAFTSGDQYAFRFLYQKHYKYVYDFASKRLNYDKELASEISSQTFVNFYKYAGRFNSDYNIKVSSFLCEIANNLIIDNYRKLQRRVEARAYSLSDTENSIEDLILPTNQGQAPDTLLDRKMTYRILYSQIAKLDNVSHQIILYFYKDELSYQEICEKLDLPLHLVKTKLFRAKKKLRSYLLNSGLR